MAIPNVSPKGVFGALALVLVAGCATTPPTPPPAPLADRVDALLDGPPFHGVHWGVLLVDPADGSVLYERNADRRFTPASNLKVPVAVAALGLLGPDYRWHTSFHASTRPFDGVIAGDLYLRGTGDPTLGAPYHAGSGEALRVLADSLIAAGVREVEGDLVLEGAAWDSTSVPGAWMVGNLSETYSATGGIFAVGRGELHVHVLGGAAPGEPAIVDWSPRGREAFVEADVRTGSGGGQANPQLHWLPETRRWRISGEVPPGEVRRFELAARDPVRLGLDALAATLEERGIIVRGSVRVEWNSPAPGGAGCAPEPERSCPGRVHLATHRSPPLMAVLPEILGASQNWITEQVVRTVGMELGGSGSWENGLDEIRAFLESEVGLDPLDLHFRDGSGLSAYNLATPRALVRTLAFANAAPWTPPFRELLPAPGLQDTTLDGRLFGLEGRVFAKTGTISHVNALSGYLITPDGRELIFSVLSNAANLPADRVRARIDAVVRELASPRG